MKHINPFKFGSVVDEPFFTNRHEELSRIHQALSSSNHLIMISPRRFGKTSLIRKAVKNIDRKVLYLDIQLVSSNEDFASQYLKRIYRLFPSERIHQFIKNFRIIPTLSLNPTSNEMEISFQTAGNGLPILEDVLNLLEKLSNPGKRTIVILDEFQDIKRLGEGIDRMLRSILQLNQNINYVFLGSQESMMRDIFEKKKSPFYHFGLILTLQKIENKHFKQFIISGLKSVTENPDTLADEILDFTDGHPYYTQQLAYSVWNILNQTTGEGLSVKKAIEETIQTHDLDYERLWGTFNNTDKKILIGLTKLNIAPLSTTFAQVTSISSSSTVFSSLKRLLHDGYIIRTEIGYEFDDPFFKQWLINRREIF